MARDYAKGSRRSTSTRRKPANRKRSKRTSSGRGSALRAYFAGLLSGVFLSCIAYLAMQPVGETPDISQEPTPQPKQAEPEVSFEFYERLKEQRVEVDVPVVEPAVNVSKPRATAVQDVFVLQAGAFRQRDDADSRRAQLLMLGLEPYIQASGSGGDRLFRVYLGPFDSRQAMNRARALTAGQSIETFVLTKPRD